MFKKFLAFLLLAGIAAAAVYITNADKPAQQHTIRQYSKSDLTVFEEASDNELSLLVSDALEGDGETKLEAVRQLSLNNSQIAQKGLLSVLADKNPQVRAAAVLGLACAECGDNIPQIEKLLADSSPLVRTNAVITLGRLGSEQSLQKITRLLKNDSSAAVKCSALDFIGQFGYTEDTLKTAAALVCDSDAQLKYAAAHFLDQAQTENKYSFLEKHLLPSEKNICTINAYAVIKSTAAAQNLIGLLDSKNQQAVTAALEALTNNPSPKAKEAMENLLLKAKGEQLTALFNAINAAALEYPEIFSEETAKKLTQMLDKGKLSKNQKTALITVLGNLKYANAYSALAPLAKDKDYTLHAITALGKLNNPSAIDIIKEYTGSENANIRKAAGEALSHYN